MDIDCSCKETALAILQIETPEIDEPLVKALWQPILGNR